jgi:SAM-dependent methyltransferase
MSLESNRSVNEFDIQSAVPWGRSFSEYTRMFSLGKSELGSRILDCGGGPASFNAELSACGVRVVSVDPLYSFTAAQIEVRVRETYPKIMDGVRRAYDRFVWKEIRSPEHLGEIRLAAMKLFVEDFESGKLEGRYVAGALPRLPFEVNSFDLVLVSHLLFLYSDTMDLDFHVTSLRELVRVAPEVRVFPLLAMDGNVSPHLAPTIGRLSAEGFRCELRKVDYEFQLGGHTMLIVAR